MSVKFKLCWPGRGRRYCATKKQNQCPTVRLTSKNVTIEDDFGGRVRMTMEQFRLLVKKGKQY